MNDGWRRERDSDRSDSDDRWNTRERIRVGRRFRHHVRTKWNPKGRIVRGECAFKDHPDHLEECTFAAPPEAHHVDYRHPFRVVWLCVIAHRRVDHGGLKVRSWMIHDYSSLVRSRPDRWVECQEPAPARKRTGTDDAPF